MDEAAVARLAATAKQQGMETNLPSVSSQRKLEAANGERPVAMVIFNPSVSVENGNSAMKALQSDWAAATEASSTPSVNLIETETEKKDKQKARDARQPAEHDDENLQTGSKLEIQELYSAGKTTCQCCITWTDKDPFKSSDENGDSVNSKKKKQEACAIIRKREAHGGESELKTHSIQINSTRIKTLLANVFADDLSIDPSAPILTFTPPFASLIHRWEKLVKVVDEEADEDNKAFISLLKEMLDPEVQEPLKALKHLEETGCIPYDQIVLAFIPGEVIIFSENGQLEAGILRSVETRTEPFDQSRSYCVFDVDVVDWDGEQFGFLSKKWTLGPYLDGRSLIDLNVYPLRVHPNLEKVKSDLIQRGRRFEELQGRHFMSYKGSATFAESDNHPLFGRFEKEHRRPVNDRIIVDAVAYYKLQNECPPQLKPLTKGQVGGSLNGVPHMDPMSPSKASDPVSLTDEQCLLAVSRVRGFALQSKVWAEFDIPELKDIAWNKDAFGNLVLPEAEKSLLLAMVDPDESIKSMTFDDFITGKGKGVIMLLCGPPGVGKSLTAEAIAERIHKPLYRLSAADLGTKVSTVEPKLQEALERAAVWDAVLLIDEADVFLEARSSENLEHNELVTIFLRLLEFYEGIMILTTNRMSAIDAAFESRLDIILTYDDLDQVGRKQIWQNFISTMRPGMTDLVEKNVETLSHFKLNGRQIKSAIKTGLYLAAKDVAPLSLKHLEIVIGLRQKACHLLGNTALNPPKKIEG